MRILAINPGSTSTKISVFDDHDDTFTMNIKHTTDEICSFKCVMDQHSFRKDIIVNELKQAGVSLQSINVVVGRGGLVKPIPGGVYKINDAL